MGTKLKAVKQDRKRIMCDNCGKHPAVVKDSREDYYGNIINDFVCRYCLNLNDIWYVRVKERKLDPKKVLEG